MARKTEDRILTGISEIEAGLRRSRDELLSLRRDFGFPLGKNRELNQPQVKIAEVRAWLDSYGLKRLSEATPEKLYSIIYRHRIADMENIELIGLTAISNAAGCTPVTVDDWFRHFDGCPIKRNEDGKLTAGKRDLLLWMRDRGIPRGTHHTPTQEELRHQCSRVNSLGLPIERSGEGGI